MPHSIAEDETTSRNHVPFWTEHNLADNESVIPTYLFRLSDSQSDGKTTKTHVCPPSPRNENLLDLDSCVGADRLYKHFMWKRGHETSCNFMSWSSSLLFLLQYVFYRHTWMGDKFDDIKLLVVDTTKLPKGTFAKDMDLLNILNTACACDYHKLLEKFVKMRKGKCYFGEYLTQGSLEMFEGECRQVTFREMVDLGLFKLLPEELKDKRNWKKWANVVVLSRLHFGNYETASSASEDEVTAAIAIAKTVFIGPWSLAVAAMLLGFKPRRRNDPVILKGFFKTYGGEHL